MVICAMIGCSNRSDRDGVRFFKLPKVVTDRGEQMLTLTTERQLLLLLLLLLLAAVTYNQVQPLRINYLATEFLPKLELYG